MHLTYFFYLPPPFVGILAALASESGKSSQSQLQKTSRLLNARILPEQQETSDPRDQVYGLLGLIDLGIVPDYSENTTVADDFLEACRKCLKATSPNILFFAGSKHGGNGPYSIRELDLPSWVPDWRLPSPATVRVHRYPQSHAFPFKNGELQMQIIGWRWLQGPAVVWDTVLSTEIKTGWDLGECDLTEAIDVEKPSDLAYPSGITRFQAMIILWLGGYDGTNTKMCDLQLDSTLFQSYEYIFFANIAQPWAKKHVQHQMPKLYLVFGWNSPIEVPRNHREAYVARSRQLRYDMRCFHTEKGYIGFGPLATEVGDAVCVLEGHKFPVLLRRRGSHYIFFSDCDVVGIMNGEVLEAVNRGEAEIIEIQIK